MNKSCKTDVYCFRPLFESFYFVLVSLFKAFSLLICWLHRWQNSAFETHSVPQVGTEKHFRSKSRVEHFTMFETGPN